MLTSKKVSESIRLGSILMFSGGFLDAYSYLVRGQVFATAETGNIALMGISLARGDLAVAGRYLIPVAAYAAGIFLTEWIRMRVGENGTVLAGFMPQKWNSLVNCLIGFSCAMQVEAFRKMHGMAFATTMCTGNLRSGTELLAVGTLENNGEQRKHGLWYYWIDLVFVAGAAASALLCQVLAERAVWVCAAALLSAILFIRYHRRMAEV